MRAPRSAPILALVVLALAPTLMLGTPAHAAELSRQDRTFAEGAMAGGRMQVELGQIAQAHASRQEVRAYGQRMVRDHRANLRRLDALVKPLGLTPPSLLPASQQHQVDRLSALHGRAFDSAYMAIMVQDHADDIRAYHKEIANGSNRALKSYAEHTLPMLQRHLAAAEDLAPPQGASLPPYH